MFAAGFTIPARAPDYHVSMSCCYDGTQPLTAVAFRVHTHTLGRLVWLERGHSSVESWSQGKLGNDGMGDDNPALLLRRSPLLPQAFALVSDQAGARNPGGEEGGGDSYVNTALPGPLIITPGTRLRATCRFNASESDHAVSAGASSKDEMCNLYLLFSADAPTALGCYSDAGADVATESGPVPPVPPAEARLAALSSAWSPPGGGLVGQVSGLDLSPDRSIVWLFHRGERVWDERSFDESTHKLRDESPLAADAVLSLSAATGELQSSWGQGMFLMPHGLSVDVWGHVWVTDVGLHQVLKFSPEGQRLLAVGSPRMPGSGELLCKPTAVAVASDGSFFVADGYCNSRVVAYAPNGTLRGFWTADAKTQGAMQVPHALALDECAGVLHVADRENGRVLSLGGVLTRPPAQWTLAGSWKLTPQAGLPYALSRAPGGDVYALGWRRGDLPGGGGSAGGARLARLSGARAARQASDAPPAAVWDLPGVMVPHALAVAPPPGAGPGLVLYVGETRAPVPPPPTTPSAPPASNAAAVVAAVTSVANAALAAASGSSVTGGGARAGGPLRFALGEVNPCAWHGACDQETHAAAALAIRAHTAGVGPAWAPAPSAAQRRRVLLTRAALVLAVGLIIAAAAAPSARGARLILPGAGAGGEAAQGAPGRGPTSTSTRGKARKAGTQSAQGT